jgi:protein phosphatase
MTTSKPTTAAATSVGRVREGNEDAYGTSETAWVVADGLGGHAGGEVASELAVQAAMAVLSQPSADPAAALAAAYEAASDAVTARAAEQPALADMATTMVAAVLLPGAGLYVGNVGDSRAYLLAGRQLQQVTRDDNLAEELLARGVLTPEEARVHPGQYQLTRALGLGDYEPTVHHLPSPAGRLLLCSDGLNSEVPDAEIGRLLASGGAHEACDQLVAAALEAGGSDNITVVVVDL